MVGWVGGGVSLLIIMPLLRPNPFGFFPQGRVWQNLYNFHLMKEKAAEFIKLWYKIYDHFEVEYGLGGSREFLL